MKDNVSINLSESSVADEVARTRQRMFKQNARRREERARQSAQTSLTSSSHGLARAVSAVVKMLPETGAIAMDWGKVLQLVHLDEPSEDTLRELQEALRAKRVLAAFGSRTVVFARDPE